MANLATDSNRVGKPAKSYSFRLLRILVGAVLAILCAHLLLQYLNLVIFHEQNGQIFELSNRLDLDDETSVPTWFSQILFLAIGISALLAAYLQTNKASRRLWGFIAAVGLVFSMDEAASLHEFILQSIHLIFFQDSAPTIFKNAWWLIMPLILLAATGLFWQMIRLLPKRTLYIFWTGGIIFLIGTIVIDALTVAVPKDTFLSQGVMVGIEETLELLANIIILYAISDYIETRYYDELIKRLRRLKTRGPNNTT
jgi:hypothetical protein